MKARLLFLILLWAAPGVAAMVGNGITDLNWEADGVIGGPPVVIFVRVQAAEYGGTVDPSAVTVDRIDIAMSCSGMHPLPGVVVFGNCVAQSNVAYAGDGSITENTCPWTWVSSNPGGGTTGWVTFRPGAALTVTGPGQPLRGECTFKFDARVTAWSADYPDPDAVGYTVSEPNKVTQLATFYGRTSDDREFSSLYGSQTYIRAAPRSTATPLCATICWDGTELRLYP